MNSLLVITGGMGAGKTSVLAEASDILALRRLTHAAIDADALGLAFLPAAASTDGAMYSNLWSVLRNYAELGVERFLVARALEDRTQLDLFREKFSAKDVVVCRLTASLQTMKRRVQNRETGISQRVYVARVTQLNVILDRARLEDFSVNNDNRSLSEVAMEMLVKAGWVAD